MVMKKIILAIIVIMLAGCNTNAQKKNLAEQKTKKQYAVAKTTSEWKEVLTDKQYYVLRQKGTERAFTGKYYELYEPGTYLCAGCEAPLYKSDHKYDSGSGWPSFDRGFDKNLEYTPDTSFGMTRTEVSCASCGGHLGHVFDDGPRETTGTRHCINSAALKFIPENDGQ
jgi:peptide-methionine (R)-S-oxide reductase